jgi:hypothetical protein
MSELKLPADSGGGSISIKGPSSSSADVDLLDTTGDLNLKDNKKLKLGDSGDLSLYHDGSHSRIKNTTGYIILNSDTGILLKNEADDENFIVANNNGSVELAFDGSKKFETHTSGCSWEGSGTGNGEFKYINTTSNTNRHAEYRFERTGGSRGLCSIIYMGENSSSQGEVMIYGSAANSNISGGVRLVDGATSWVSASDMRLKDKTGDITNALTDIAKIEPIKFTWKADTNKTPHVGVSAQSIENVVPEAVSKSKDKLLEEKGDDTEYLGVRYTELIPLCIAALKEAKTKIETLETKVETLETKVAALEAS